MKGLMRAMPPPLNLWARTARSDQVGDLLKTWSNSKTEVMEFGLKLAV